MSEIDRNPKNLFLPKGFKWPKAVKKEIELWDSLYGDWAETQTVLFERRDAAREAEAADAKALIEAVSEGREDPGAASTAEAQRAVVFQEEVVRQARLKADTQASKTSKAIDAHLTEVVREAISMALAGAQKFEEDAARISKAGQEMLQRRSDALAGIKYVSKLVGPTLSFDPNFPVDGEVKVPRTHETRLHAIVTLLEKWLDRETTEAA